MTSRHFTMISLGSVTAILPNGEHIRHPLNFAFSGSASALVDDTKRQATIDELVAENAQQFSESLRKQGAQIVQCEVRPVANVL